MVAHVQMACSDRCLASPHKWRYSDGHIAVEAEPSHIFAERGHGCFHGSHGLDGAFGIIILSQSDVVEEKQSGTTKWVLSSPLSRESFVFSKLYVNLTWLVATLVLRQGVVFNLFVGLFNVGLLSWLNLAQGLGLQGLNLSFAFVLNSIFQSRTILYRLISL